MLLAKKNVASEIDPPDNVGIVFKLFEGGYYYGYYSGEEYLGCKVYDTVKMNTQIGNDGLFEFACWEDYGFKENEVEFWWNVSVKLEL